MFQFVRDLKTIHQKQKTLTRQEAAHLMSQVRLPAWLELISAQSVWVVVSSMWLGSAFFVICYLELLNQQLPTLSLWQKALFYCLVPVVFALSFVTIGGLISQVGKFGEIPGKFPRVAGHPIYALRRIYGTAWAQVFYFKPLYAVFLAVPFLKRYLFKIFGYKGSTNFTLYPDAWVRDLPLLKIGDGVYLANRCTVGTNLCLSDGSIVVGECRAEEKSMVGHLVIFGLGCVLGKSSELGVNASLGIRVLIKEHSILEPQCLVYHGVEIGKKVKVGPWAYVGIKSKIGDGVEIAPGAVIPNGAIVSSQKEADQYFSSENQKLKIEKDDLTDILRKNMDEFVQTDQ